MDASSILANHQLSQEEEVEQQISSHTCPPTSSTLPQLLSQQLSPQPLQTIAHNNSTNINNNQNDNSTKTSNNPNIRPQLVPFNKLSPQLSSILSSQQSINNPNLIQALNNSSLPSLVTDSRQSSEDSGYNEPTSSSNNTSNSSGGKTYAQVMGSVDDCSNQRTNNILQSIVVYNRDTPLCPYATNNIDGICPYSEGQCHYLHGDVCDLCGRSCLHPNDVEQQRQHRDVSRFLGSF